MVSKRYLSLIVIVLALIGAAVFLAEPNMDGENNARSHSPINAMLASKPENKNWTPNETLTGNVLAANFAQGQRDWSRANEYLERLNSKVPNDIGAALRMMLLALGAGQFERAADYARNMETLKMTPEEAADPLGGDGRDLASLVLMSQAVRSGDLTAAEKRLGEMKSQALIAFVQPVLMNWIKAGQKKPLDASAEGLSLLQALHRGLAAEWSGQIDVANKVFDSLARIPLTPAGAMVVAAYNIRQGRADQARAALAEAIRQNPLDMDAKAMMDALGQGQSPIMKLEWSYHLQGVTAGTALALRDLAQMMVGDQAADSALVFAQLGRMIRNDVPGLSLLVGAIFTQQERYFDAAAVLTSIQLQDVDYVEAQIRLSELRDREGDTKQAAKILETLMQSNPSPRVAYALGEIKRQDKDFKGAVRAYDQAVELSGGKADDDLWSVYYVRAMAYDELGEWDKAEADLKTALSYRPDNPHVLNYLGYSYADKNINLIQARDMIVKALTFAPTDPYITDSLGWLYFRQGDLLQAAAYIERAVSLKPYDPVVNDHLGDIYEKIGRTLEARYQWRRALDYADPVKDVKLIEKITKKLQEK